MSSRWNDETAEDLRLLAQEELILAASELVSEALEARDVQRADFAELLGVKRSEISQRLSGKRNLTFRSFADMLHVLDFKLDMQLVDCRADDTPVWETHVTGSARPRHATGRYTKTGSSLVVCGKQADAS